MLNHIFAKLEILFKAALFVQLLPVHYTKDLYNFNNSFLDFHSFVVMGSGANFSRNWNGHLRYGFRLPGEIQ